MTARSCDHGGFLRSILPTNRAEIDSPRDRTLEANLLLKRILEFPFTLEELNYFFECRNGIYATALVSSSRKYQGTLFFVS